ncbi:hypothetical protein LVY72_11975 [Arthrobacter sp. I2-34]|uniref:Uncharacterized protein n=1 Tax=Arthrobacter hankyongi TaxID=2904801 RepID=A0ABS9L7I5_9MICC|nr:hypothetical protein [Arthrobacter hankyongi]MCG2622624.1 hypothetical protein [Arthrobacter hankyongi]
MAEIDIATAVVDGFWTRHWSEYFSGTYTAPTVMGAYDGNATDAPFCGPEVLPPGNAVYCLPDDFVAWDLGLMERGYAEGDAWPYVVIAHEWGHAIQARLDSALTSTASELQADCLAGATLYGSARDGHMIFEAGDQKEIVDILSFLGDETPWTSSADHGDPFDRVDAFDAGRRGGVGACLPGLLEETPEGTTEGSRSETVAFGGSAEYGNGVTVWVEPLGYRPVSEDAAGAVNGQAAVFEMTIENHSGSDLNASHMSYPAVFYYGPDRKPAHLVTDIENGMGFDFLGTIPSGTTRTGEFAVGIPASGAARVRVDVPGPDTSLESAVFEGCFCYQ